MIPITHPQLLQFAYKHYEAVEQQLRSNGNYQTVSQWFEKNGLGMSLKEAIMASVPLMERMIKAYGGIPTTSHLKDMYTERFSKSSRWIGDEKYTSADLVKNLGIKVCPYCNRNYVNNVPTQKKVKRTSELDHFFNKDTYPFLAMSFFNLVPVCPSCNLLKYKYDVSASPYDFRIPWDEAVRFNYGITHADFLKDERKVYVKVKLSGQLEGNFDVLHLRNQYSMHNDVVHELLVKGVMYSPRQLDDFMKKFSGLFRSKKEMMRIIYGNYLEDYETGKRPLSKLTRDIVNRLYF